MKVIDRTTPEWESYRLALARAWAEYIEGTYPNPRHYEAAVERATSAFYRDYDPAAVVDAGPPGPVAG